MFEDGEIQSLSMTNNVMTKHCDFCKKKIKLMPVQDTSNTLNFCDIICAKLYYDNVKHFNINIKQYNNYYNEDDLNKKAKDIYSRCRNVIFEQLPVYKPTETDDAFNNPELMHKKYNKILSPVLFKSIGAYE